MKKGQLHFHLLSSDWQNKYGPIESKWGDPAEGLGNPGYAANKFLAIKSGLGDHLLLLDFKNQTSYLYAGSVEKINTLYSAYQGGIPSTTLSANMWDSYSTPFGKDPVLKLLDPGISFMPIEGTTILSDLRAMVMSGMPSDNSVDARADFYASISSINLDPIALGGGAVAPVNPSGGPSLYSVLKNWSTPKNSPSAVHIQEGEYGGAIFTFDNPTWSNSGLTIRNDPTFFSQSNSSGSILTVTDKSDNQGFSVNVAGSVWEIAGTDGNDTITDGAGSTNIIPMGGSNTIDGGAGIDSLSYFHSDPSFRFSSVFSSSKFQKNFPINGVSASLATGTARTSNSTDSFTNIEAITGSQYNDRLIGNSADNQFTGMAGNDFIDGGGGIDTLNSWWASPDGINVNLSNQVYTYRKLNPSIYNADWNTVLNPQSALDGWGGRDTVLNFENVNGTQFADVIIGNDQNNVIRGGGQSMDGMDNIHGKGGADLIEVSGRTRVYYENIRDSMPDRNGRELADVIVHWGIGGAPNDFNNYLEIVLDAIDANTQISGNQAFGWSIDPNTGGVRFEFTGTAGELVLKDINNSSSEIYVGLGISATSAVSIQGDINGDAIADLEIKIVGISSENYLNNVFYSL
jgi:hypothetical protein